MKLALKNIFKVEEPLKRYVTIIKRISAKKYETQDIYGRKFYITSSDEWKPGTNVIIQNGQILRKTGSLNNPIRMKG